MNTFKPNATWFTKGALVALCITPFISTASLVEDQDSLVIQKLKPVSINAVRVQDNSPFAHENLNKEELERNNTGKDLPYLLNSTPSLIINSDAGAGVGYTGLRIRGSDLGRINFTINGVPINDPESQVVMFVNFPDLLSSTESIQIQRGVGSSTNGGGAFGASIHVNNSEQSEIAQAEVMNSYGSFNTWRHTVKAASGKLNNGFQFDVRASKISSDGYIDRASADLKSLHFIAGWTSKDEKTNLKFNLFTGKEKTYQAWNGISEEQLKENRTYNPVGIMEDGTFYNDQTDNYQQDYYQLLLDHSLNPYWQLNAGLFLTRGRGYYNEYRIKDKLSEYGFDPIEEENGSIIDRVNALRQRWLDNYYYGGIYSLKYTKNKTQVLLGGSITSYEGDHYGFVKWAERGIPVDHQWYLNTSNKKDFNAYLKLEQEITSGLTAFAELQYRWVDYEMNGFRKLPDMKPHPTYNFVNPKAGLSYVRYHENGALSKIYGSFATANKEPNRKDFEESPTVWAEPEQLFDFELGYQYQKTNLNAGLNFYYMNYNNQLINTGKINDYGVYGRINVAESYRRGIELMLNYQPLPSLLLAGNLTLSQNHILDFEEYIDDYDNGGQIMTYFEKTDISFSPNVVAAASVLWYPALEHKHLKDLNLQAQFKYVGRQYLDNTTNKNRSLNPYETIDLSIGYDLPINFTKGINLNFSVNNVLNKMYEANGLSFSYLSEGEVVTENYYFPQAGIHFMLGVNIKF